MDREVQQRQRERFELLSVLYDLSPGEEGVTHDYARVREQITFDPARGWQHAQYLHQEGLLRLGNLWLEITHAGLKEIERARERPDQPTKHFEAGVTNYIFNVNAPVGALQTGSGATAHVGQHFGSEQQAALLRALDLVAEGLQRKPLPDPRSNAELVALVAECKGEVAKPSPNFTKIKLIAGGIASTIRTVAALKGAYDAIVAAVAYFG
jgi:hypothetical protein